MQGQAQKEKLIVVTKAVAIAHLLIACQVKADGTTGDYWYILVTQSCTVNV